MKNSRVPGGASATPVVRTSWRRQRSDVAAAYAGTIAASITREYPNALRHVMTHDGDTPTPRAAHPAFYGCFDWHSAVEMHWALIRMLRTVPGAFDAWMLLLRDHGTRPLADVLRYAIGYAEHGHAPVENAGATVVSVRALF